MRPVPRPKQPAPPSQAIRLRGTENRIAVSRQDYNNAVQEFNASIKQFPTVLYAGILGFSQRDYFEVPESAKAVPQVQF